MSMIGNFMAVTDLELRRLFVKPERVADFLYDENADARKEIDVDKAWHAIHFLLTGDAWGGALPLAFIVLGNEIGDVDVGYGPARGFTSAQVKQIDEALRDIDAATLMSRWDARAVRAAEIYGVDPDNVEDETDYVGGYYESLREFVREAAAADCAIIVYVN